MSDLDIENLLTPISEEAPCGEDIEDDLSYFALVDLVQPKGQGTVATAGEKQAEEPNWGDVGEASIALLRRSRHLSVAMYLTLSLLRRKGLAGLRDGLYLVRELLDRFWDHMYPQLDAGNRHSPFRRINVLESLSPHSVSDKDPFRFKQRLLDVPLCRSGRMGSFSLRDVQIARGELPPRANQAASNMAVIEAAFRDTPVEELAATSQAAREAVEHLDAIVAVFAAKAAGGQTPNLMDLKTMLRDIERAVRQFLGVDDPHESVEEKGQGESAPGQQSMTALAGEVKSRKDVLLALDRVCRYFDQNEPSSPVPLLLRRAQRLVSKSFLEIVQDMCPDAMGKVQSISGALPHGEGEQASS